MPTLHLMSDVHFEFHRDGGASFVDGLDPAGADVLVLAGDVGVVPRCLPALERLVDRYPQVVMVCGNHEFYGTSREDVYGALAELEARRPTFRVLEDRVVEVAGARFVGSTLWFADAPGNDVFARALTDFRVIPRFVDWVYDVNARSAAFLERTVRAGDVVITHHIPDRRGVHPRWSGPTTSELNRFFLCQLPEELLGRAACWVFGHTHDAAGFRIGACDFHCNPLGYLGHEVTGEGYRPAVLRV